MSLEDKTARGLGVNVNLMRILISLVAVLLASISTAVVGAISFLGLIVPHIGRLLVGSDHRALVPFSMLAGAFTFLLADTIGRTVLYHSVKEVEEVCSLIRNRGNQPWRFGTCSFPTGRIKS